MNIKVAHLITSNNKSGGNLYESYLQALNDTFEINHIVLNLNRNKIKLLKAIEYFWTLYRFSRKEYLKYDISIRNEQGCFFMDKTKINIVIFHHYDPHPNNLLIRLYQKILYKNLLKNLPKIDMLVVVSEYWQEYFKKIGFTKTTIIYNPFEIEKYALHNLDDLEKFKYQYKLNKKPIVYIGNAQAIKGAHKVYETLKFLDVHLVTSGISQISLPTINLDLSFKQYTMLLQISSVVVLMSQIKEGWNRVAHEAILCHTPVIGSGSGGMNELLTKSDQQICNDWSKLEEMVIETLKGYSKNEVGYNYAKQFSIDKFKLDWIKLINELHCLKMKAMDTKVLHSKSHT
ncbi:MAG: glycosyltransferase [Candidatus Paceibacterota bacterium]|jgi:glycosyltransferase involved in cell wall biosynthesis